MPLPLPLRRDDPFHAHRNLLPVAFPPERQTLPVVRLRPRPALQAQQEAGKVFFDWLQAASLIPIASRYIFTCR